MFKSACFFTFVILSLLFFSPVARGADISRSEAEPMEKFLSHFVENTRENVRFGSPAQKQEAKKILDFAVRFAQIDNADKVQNCPRENCPHGPFRIEKKYVDEAIKFYFGHDPQNYPLLNGKDYAGFERDFYHFGQTEGTGMRARVREAKLQPVGLMLMRGDILDHMGEVIDKFTALAWPAQFGTQNTWSMVSLVYDSSKNKNRSPAKLLR